MRKSVYLKTQVLCPLDVVDHMVENVIGVFPEPLGIGR